MALIDLNDAQLRHVMKDIQQEAVRREGAIPPRGSPIECCQAPAGAVDTDLVDEEVSLQGVRGWGPGKPPQQPTGPLEQRRMLITSSSLAAKLRLGTLRINTFSSDATPGKTEVSFE